MATWCEPCRDEFPLMSTFAARYEEKGLIVRGAWTSGRTPETVAAFMDEAGGDVPDGARRAMGRRSASGARSPCRSTSGSTRRGSSATAPWVASAPTLMAEALGTILPGVEVTLP